MAGQLEWTPELRSYVREVSLRDDPVLTGLREQTERLPGGRLMQVSPEEGQFLATLVSLTGARTVIEVGTYTGYSALCMARALPPDGRLITCDITERWSPVAREFWQRAGVADRIEQRIGDAATTLSDLLDTYGPAGADLIFIDADKAGYLTYYELALSLVRPNGLIVIDNTLLFGKVVDEDAQDSDTRAIRELNLLLHADERVEIALLPMADGVTLARKRPTGLQIRSPWP
ncbi:O-methyltransferase [Nonomuraea sp. NPDC059023]|uniref:O-methyltransferase n=1 Tax=unclassified Nonomuraea TaxID=2593643 RepID=UPI0036764BD5